MKQLQHTSETDETFGTYTCNMAIATYATSRSTFATPRRNNYNIRLK
jgi:hypothetical protein